MDILEGEIVGALVNMAVGAWEGVTVGALEGFTVDFDVVGLSVDIFDGLSVNILEGLAVGILEGFGVGFDVEESSHFRVIIVSLGLDELRSEEIRIHVSP